ncbi:hypothetical protein H2201_001882 [Coniosporium apollinis]|uniref:Heterokaryon incompatibility domain-containing protein n=1 Tax=Coniosporium apollinis TaxID=61459 RepID=A0ABQ9P424_9PEZI|nr:hypothetical protein H2201_001882 [Coniosporium apollinis]
MIGRASYFAVVRSPLGPLRGLAARATQGSVAIRRSHDVQKEPQTIYHHHPFDPVKPSFEYLPLDPGKREIRLVKVLPFDQGQTTDGVNPVSCTLHHVSLDDGPEYVALSYSWGDPHDIVPILVDGCSFLATQNLEAALRQFRDDGQHTSRPLWIDAICINQKDDAEKSSQVQCMRTIYHDAVYVVSWLGIAAAGTGATIKELKELRDEGCDIQAADRADVPTLEFYLERFLGLFRPLFDLFERDYWSRVWVLQEVAVARDVRIQCGPLIATLEELAIGLSLLVSYDQRTFTHSPNIQRKMTRFFTVQHGRRRFQSKDVISLQGLLYDSSCFGLSLATDPRDKVYALLGLVKNSDGLGIKPDYSLSTEELYIRTGKAMIEDGDLPILLCTMRRGRSQLTLPSWVPDWSVGVRFPIITTRARNFNASGNTRSSFQLSDIETQPILALSGVRVDTIRSTKAGDHGEIGHPEYGSWLSELKDRCSHEATIYATAEQQRDAIWKTLIVDHVSTRRGESIRTSEADKRDHEALLRSSQLLLDEGPDGDYSENYRSTTELTEEQLFITDQGYLGRGPKNVQPGDQVCIILGLNVPSVLRKAGGGQYRLVGPAYVHGIMDGEFMERGVGSVTFELI